MRKFLKIQAVIASLLVLACFFSCKDDDDDDDDGGKITGASGVYSYTVNIDDISTAWGGSKESPAFSILLLTDEQLDACVAANDFKQADAAKPEYQMAAYDNLKIADTGTTGSFAIYGKKPVDDVFQYYEGVAVTVDESTVTVIIDMTKIEQTALKSLYSPNGEKMMTSDDTVNLEGYKPYILALASQEVDPDSYKMTGWNGDLMTMVAGATFPANATKNAPIVPTTKDATHISGTITDNWEHVKLQNDSYEFTFDAAAGLPRFSFSSGTWDYKLRGAVINELNKEFELSESAKDHCTFKEGVLTAGKTYIITINRTGNHEATVKVTEKIM